MATHSTDRVLPTTRIEVARSEKSLLLEIAEGGVPLPPLCTYREWLHWRRTEGKRPTKTQGDPQTTTGAEESLLWKAVLSEIYGEDWKEALKEQKEAEFLAEQELGISPEYFAMTPGGSRGPVTEMAFERPVAGAEGTGGARGSGAETAVVRPAASAVPVPSTPVRACLLYTSDAADECVNV
mgnify:FL=1